MSNLLEKASILTTPTAYNDGKLLSVKPEPSLGSELITNGSFDTDSNWTFGTGWSIGEDKAVFNDTANGDIRTSSTVFTANKKYQIKLTVADLTSGTAFFALGAGTASNLVSYANYTNGDYTFEVISPNSLELRIYATTSSGSSFSIDNVSVKELIDGDFDFTRGSSATRVNAQGLVEDVGNNLPRIDYTDGVGSWLFEPQSTNLVTYSEVYGSGTYFSSFQGSTFDNTTSLSPSGENNASQLTSTGAGKLQTAGISLSQNTDYTLSFYAKNVDATEVQSRVLALGGSGGSNLIPISYFSELSTTEWKRITHSFNTGTNTTFYLYLLNALNSGGTIQIWGAQLEQNSFATSYIPTNGSTVTRLQDAAFGAGSSDLINSTSGVLYAEIAALSDDGTNRIIGLFKDGDATNRINIFYTSGSNKMKFVVRVNNTNVFNTTITLSDIANYNKVALSFKENEFKVYINGVKEAEQLSGSIYPINTLDKLNFDQSGGTFPFYGKTKCLAVFKEALTDEELTCLTTI